LLFAAQTGNRPHTDILSRRTGPLGIIAANIDLRTNTEAAGKEKLNIAVAG
jgi:hypothetical protein